MNPNILGVIGPGFLNQVPTVLRNRIVVMEVTSWEST